MDDNIVQHLMEIKESQARTETTVADLKREFIGHDSNPGIRQRIESLEGDRRYIYGFGGAITFIGAVFEWLVHTVFKGKP